MAMHVVTALPWKEIIKVLPSLVTTASRLWEQLGTKPAPVNPQDEPREQIAALLQRIETLEAAQVTQAKLLKEMIEQLQGISAGLAQVSRRNTLLLAVSLGALALSITGLLLA